MADRKISQFTAATEFQGADDIPLVRGATNLKGKISLLAQAILAINGSGGTPVAPTDFKDSVLVATTANITLSGEQTIDGTLTNASRVLVWFQTNPAQNGLYLSGAGAWTRTTDADDSTKVTPGMLVVVEAGATYANIAFTLTTAGTIVLGTTPLTFSPVVLPTVTFPVKTVNQTTYSHLLLDSGRRLVFTNAATKTFTVASFTGGGGIKSAVNTEIDGFNAGAGALTIAPAGGVTINAQSLVVPQYGYFKLKKRSNPNEWDLSVVGGASGPGLATTNVFTKSNTVADFALTDAATVAINYANSNNFFLQLTTAIGGTRALGMPTNATPGGSFNLRVKQPATGGPCVLTYPAGITWGTGGAGLAPTLSVTANAVDVLGFVYDAGTSTWRGSMISSTGALASLATTNVFSKSQTVQDVALTDAATVALDYALSNSFTLLLTSAIGATRALGMPTNPTPGAAFHLRVKQPASGGPCVLTYPAGITWGTGGGGLAPTLATAANAVDVLGFIYDAGTATWRGAMISTAATPSVGTSTVVTALAIVAGVVTVDLSLGDYYTLVLNANVTSWVFTNKPGVGKGTSKWIRITQGLGPYTVAWDTSFYWEGGTVPSVSTGNTAVDDLALTTVDNGTTWHCTLAKAWASPYATVPILQSVATTMRNTGTGDQNVVMTMPAGIVAGDLLVAVFGYNDDTGAQVIGATGWTIVQNTPAGGNKGFTLLKKVAVGGDTLTVTNNPNGRPSSGIVARISGGVNLYNASAGLTSTFASLTPAGGLQNYLWLCASTGGNAACPPPAGFSDNAYIDSTFGGPKTRLFSRPLTAAVLAPGAISVTESVLQTIAISG